MKVGIYFDLRNSPGMVQGDSKLYGFTLEMCEEAESLGCDSIWLSEHHLFDDGYLPQPLVLAAAVAARTRRVRIGTAVVVAPLHRPVELAEQCAIVDLVSNGRFELGIGAGYRLPEFSLYDASFETRYASTDGCASELRRLWNVVTPRPAQARLPIWMGYQGPKGARRAGRLGEGLLSIDAKLWEPYREGLVEGGHDPSTARMAGGIHGWVSTDPERDWPMVAPYVAAQFDSYRRHMVEGTDAPIPRPVDPDQLRSRTDARNALNAITYGTPEHVAADIRQKSAGAPVDTVFLWASIAGMPHDDVARNIRTICTDLAPLLTDEGSS